jgi:hypothetical protein
MRVNRPDETAYSGPGSFQKVPYVLDPSELEGDDIAIGEAAPENHV